MPVCMRVCQFYLYVYVFFFFFFFFFFVAEFSPVHAIFLTLKASFKIVEDAIFYNHFRLVIGTPLFLFYFSEK